MTITDPKEPSTGESGYSMIELLMVVALIAIMAAVSLPNIAGYIRNYRIRGATQQIAGEIQTARNKGITKNTNQGVAFSVLDANTYRYFIIDDTSPVGLGPLRQLPAGVVFVTAATTPTSGMAFDRLGRFCVFGSAGCVTTTAPTPATLCPTPGELAQCTDRVPATTYVDVTGGTATVTVREEATQNLRTVQVAPGGRVLTQR
jgi:prepilin-type N-terminal cleavage/methylation domain-containing protein